MRFNFTLLCAMLLFVCAPAIAQESNEKVRTVTVLDKADNPLVGALVFVGQSTSPTLVDVDGIAQVKCADDATLKVTYVSFLSQEVKVDGRTNIKVVLAEDAIQLEEVVVIGYNRVRRAQTTGALAQVNGKEIQTQSSPSLESRLQGQTAGVMVSTGSGQPGSNDVSIRVRGTGSINGSNTPLYIMDGTMVQAADFAALNSNDIEDIQILKDASATAIYGSRGANGVIVINTKKGMSGKTKINYSNRFGVSILQPYVDMMNSEENLQYQLQCVLSEPTSNMYPMMQTLLREYNGTATDADKAALAAARATDTDWIDEMTQTSFVQDHNISFSGGNNDSRFYVSGSYTSQEGILKESGFERFSVRVNLDNKVTDWLDFGINATGGYSTTTFTDPNGSNNRLSWANPWFTALLAYPYESPEDWYNKDNPTLINKYYDQTLGSLKLVASSFLKADITKHLSVKTNLGIDYMDNKTVSTLHRDHPLSQQNHGYYDQSISNTFRYTWTNTVNYNRDFEGGHSVNAVAGMEMFQGVWNGSNFRGYDLNSEMMESPAGIGDKTGSSLFPPYIGGGRTMSNLLSFFMQGSYSYDNRYNLSVSLRNDTSSKFYEENASALFWSVGTSWLMSSESWLQDADWLNLLKLRASYGTTGNQDGISDFGTFDGYFNSSYNGESGYVHGQLGNENLRWEVSRQFNVGFTASMFDSRVNLSVDAYHITTDDLYMPKNISSTSGFTSILTNAGSIVNKGVELGVNLTPIINDDFRWDIGMNFTYNRAEIADLGTWANETNSYKNGNTLYRVGGVLGTWIMPEYAGVSPETGIVEFYDAEGNRTTDIGKANMTTDLGSSEVPMFGGFNTTFSYKGISLDAQFTYALNNTVMNTQKWFIQNHNFNGNKPTYMLDMWMEPGDITDVPAFRNGTQPSPMASQFLEDASYLRLKNLRLGWALPQSWLKGSGFLSNLSVYAQVENLFTITGYEGADPEVNGAYDYMSYPKPTIYTFGINVTF